MKVQLTVTSDDGVQKGEVVLESETSAKVLGEICLGEMTEKELLGVIRMFGAIRAQWFGGGKGKILGK